MSRLILYFASTSKNTKHHAEVAQHGQRRRTEAPIPQGFVGSNPTLRTIDSAHYALFYEGLQFYRNKKSVGFSQRLKREFTGKYDVVIAIAYGNKPKKTNQFFHS